MRELTEQEKQELQEHYKWLTNDGGKRLDWSVKDLSYANLSYANLTRASLSCANLSYANLIGASLSCANLSYANLSYANLTRADLTDADLTDANLTCANLSYANLTRADLSCANLSYANLIGASLSCANLSYANLSYADLTDADLADSNLTGADLTDADLADSNLTCANLSYANLTRADLTDADLTNTKGLTKVMGVEPGNYYWKRIDKTFSSGGYYFTVGLNKLRDGEVFASDERVLCSYPSFHFASRSWCTENYPNKRYEVKIQIPKNAKINEPWATDGKASADMIKIVQVIDSITGEDVTNIFKNYADGRGKK